MVAQISKVTGHVRLSIIDLNMGRQPMVADRYHLQWRDLQLQRNPKGDWRK